MDKTLGPLGMCYKFHAYTPTKLGELVENVVRHCDTCQTCKPRCSRHPETGHYYPIPKYPLASVTMEIVHLPACEVRKRYTVDCCFVIVDRATGYAIAIPTALNGLYARKLAEPFLEQCVFCAGFPHEILQDNAKYFNNKFVTTLCYLAGISTHKSVIYDPKTNGRARRALKSGVETLKGHLQETNTPTSQWYWKLLVALWGLNDPPAAIAPQSPQGLLFGMDPIGFGDAPPIVDEKACEEAVDVLPRL